MTSNMSSKEERVCLTAAAFTSSIRRDTRRDNISLHLPRFKTMIAGDAIVSAGEHLMVSPTYLSSDPEAAHESVKRLIQMNLDLERFPGRPWR